MTERCTYVDWEFGQLHVRQWGDPDSKKPPIFCLTPSPFSSVAYRCLAPLLAKKRHVISMDYPGYGNSYAMPEWPTINDYAKAAGAVANTLCPGRPLVFLGFHSGTLVAIEIALLAPDLVDQQVLIDIPFFDEETRLANLKEKSSATPIVADIAMLEPSWNFCIGGQAGLIPLDRAYENFVDMIASGAYRNATFRAAFSYDCAAALPEISVPITFIATQAGLFEETQRAARIVPNANLITIPEISVGVLDNGAESIASATLELLQ